MNLQEHYSLKALNSFGVDHAARYFSIVTTIEEIPKIKECPQPHLILGGGSNILFTQDYPGTVIHNRLLGIEILEQNEEEARIKVMSGENWHNFVTKMNEKGFHGLEYLALIPGSVGAAPVQNIGAYGAEVKEYIESIDLYDFAQSRFKTISPEECNFAYRDSIFKQNPGRYFISAITFKLSRNFKADLSYRVLADYFAEKGREEKSITASELMEAVIHIRSSKLPDPKEIGNGGSFFKNPIISKTQFDALKLKHPNLIFFPTEKPDEIKLAAGQLIELSGFKGEYRGQVGMYEKQALILVNLGGATGAELAEHARRVQQGVQQKFGVLLEPEPSIL